MAFGVEGYRNGVVTRISKLDMEVLHMEEAGRIRITLPVCRDATQASSEIVLHLGNVAMEEMHRAQSDGVYIAMLCYQQATRKNGRSDDENPQLLRYTFDVLAFFAVVWSRGVKVWMKWLYCYTNVIDPGAQELADFLASINPAVPVMNQAVALAKKIKGKSPSQKKKKPAKKGNASEIHLPVPISKELTSMERRIWRGQGMRRSDLQSFVLENSTGNEGSVKRTGKRNIS